MGFISWLFGKKEQTTPAVPAENRLSAPAGKETAAAVAAPEKPKGSSEVDNLRRWRESGKARAWIEARQGRWDHSEWLSLIEELKRSPFWPMQPEAVGTVLEDVKREWLRRN